MLYLIGSLRNKKLPKIAETIRQTCAIEVFDDWFAAGPEADDKWREYEMGRGHSFIEALDGHAARNTFAFDKKNIDRATMGVLVCPAGKSGHLELGYILGDRKPGFILTDNPRRWDVMYRFATRVVATVEELCAVVRDHATMREIAMQAGRPTIPRGALSNVV